MNRIIIAVLIASFAISFGLRAGPAISYEPEIHEFDPWYNYRATQYLLDNGYDSYMSWHDDMSWYPEGRDVSATSQVALHVTAAAIYWPFQTLMSLHDWVIWFPVIIGSLAVIPMFGIARIISGGSVIAGSAAALMFSASFPVIIRGMAGWFKSEPLGLTLALFSVFLIIHCVSSRRHMIPKSIGAGLLMTLAISAWGGSQFFVIPLLALFMIVPFVKKPNAEAGWFAMSLLASSFLFERVLSGFFYGIGGLILIIGSTVSMGTYAVIKLSSPIRGGIFAILLLGIIGIIFTAYPELLPPASDRYLDAIGGETSNVLVSSVAEHASMGLLGSVMIKPTLIILGLIGAVMSWRASPHTRYLILFCAIFASMGLYIGSSFARLEMIATVPMIIMAAVGADQIIRRFRKKPVIILTVIFLMITPAIYPTNVAVATGSIPPTILNGGTMYDVATDDWRDAMSWVSENTPKDSRVAAWWDYGYWIETLGNRTTFSDNATIMAGPIEATAVMFFQSPEDGFETLRNMGADYVLVFVAAEHLGDGNYILHGGGDESKKVWLMRIAGVDVGTMIYPDGLSGTPLFWDTMMGELFPYTVTHYMDRQTGLTSDVWVNGYAPVAVRDEKIKFVYASPSWYDDSAGAKIGVFVYPANG